jgi:parallel beta-helix repeat protein
VTGHGVLVSASDGAQLLKLRIDRTGGDGIAVRDSDDVLVEAARVTDAGVDGISLDGVVPLTGSSDDGEVTRCKVTDPVGVGVHVSGDGNTIERCKVVGADVAALALRTGSTSMGNTFLRNRVRKGLGDGIVLDGSGNRAERNKLVAPGGRGFVLGGTGGNTLERNSCNKAGNDGAHLATGSDGNMFFKNRLFRSGTDGLDVESDGNTFEQDRMFGSDSTGIELEGTANVFTRVRSLFSAGFDLVDSVPGNTFIKSKIGSVDPDGDD